MKLPVLCIIVYEMYYEMYIKWIIGTIIKYSLNRRIILSEKNWEKPNYAEGGNRVKSR